ncbi:integrase core domain-containing protein [Sphingobacterium thalpophilum]|uniref:integrase core domain-containing protein n=1 Tax=Sphingobacterium thalpophilum TaxID=259 RepID=UPI003D971D07
MRKRCRNFSTYGKARNKRRYRFKKRIKEKIEIWRKEYNTFRPHSCLGDFYFRTLLSLGRGQNSTDLLQ